MNSRKLFALIIALALALSAWPMALAEATDAEVALPGVGDVVDGFEVVELRDYPLIDATVVRFEHRKTGAQLFYIANDGTNRAFDLSFFTEAIDNTGLPHVFEHATIQGSEKYPGEQMYFNLRYQTYNTFMNAATDQWHTDYPIASLSEAQLLKLAEFYTDGCFYPAIMQNEHIFRTEAWRYRLESAEDPLSIEGTVYSEMLGATTLQKAANMNLLRAVFPGSLATNDFGGDPDSIPDMTWQALKDYHDLYYHPSNCAAYLYGQFEDYTAFLKLLDGYFSAFEKREFSHDDAGYAPITEPVVQSLPFPLEQGANTEHASTVYYVFVCPGLRQNMQQELVLDTMTDLFANNASSLQQRLQAAIPYGNFSVSIGLNAPDDAILFAANNVDPDDAQTFKTIVDEELSQVARDGFPQELVDSTAAALAISARLTRENSDPVMGIILPMVNRYATTRNPWDYQDYQDSLFRLDDWNRQGLYAQAISDWLLDSRTTGLVTTYPEPGAKEAHDAAMQEALAAVKAGMTDEEIAQIVEATNAEPPEDLSAESVARLKVVSVDSLPEERKLYDVTDETDDDGNIRYIEALAAVDGVSQPNIFLSAAGLAQEDIHWVQLYTGLLTQLDTAEHTKADLATLINRYLYNGTTFMALAKDGKGGYCPYLRLSWIALDDDLAAGYDLMRELLFDTKFDDPEKLLEQVQAAITGFKSTITANPANVLLNRGLARTSEFYAYSCYATGLDYYAFLGEVEQLLRDDPGAVTAKLESIRDFFNNRNDTVVMCAGNAQSIALNRRQADAFLDSLGEREHESVHYDFSIPERNEALVIDSSVQHNLLIGDLGAMGLETYDGSLDAVTSLISDTFLVPLLRDQYGVYTPLMQTTEDYAFIYAYRDPNIAQTYDVLEQLPTLIEGMELDQDTLDGYIMNAYSKYAKPLGELTGAVTAAVDVLQGLDSARNLEYMRQLKQLTPDVVHEDAALIPKFIENSSWMTGGASSAIDENADMFDVILNPFGAVDSTQVVLTDVPEGSAHYDAVRFAFEQGFMDRLTEDTFGVDEPATQGDLLAAMYVLAGGERNGEAALAAFAQYGLVSENTDLSAPILPSDIWNMLGGLTGSQVPPMTETASDDAVTRAELAEALYTISQAMTQG